MSSSSHPESDNNDRDLEEQKQKKRDADNFKFARYRGAGCFDEVSKLSKENEACTQEKKTRRRAAVSWTGGKDCHLALQRCIGAGVDVVCGAVFFVPGTKFNAHRREWQQIQGEAIGFPVIECPLFLEPQGKDGEADVSINYSAAYAAAIRRLQETMDIQFLVTGDIDFVGSSTDNFMQQVITKYPCNVEVLLPLWQQPRKDLLREMLSHNFDIKLCCVKSPHFDASWIGKKLDEETIIDMERMTSEGLDLTGENGEYHTMVVNGPMYKYPLHFTDVTAEELVDQRGQESKERWWVIPETATLKPLRNR